MVGYKGLVLPVDFGDKTPCYEKGVEIGHAARESGLKEGVFKEKLVGMYPLRKSGI